MLNLQVTLRTLITQDKCNVILLPEMALLCMSFFFRPQTLRVELARTDRRKTVDFFCDLMSSSRRAPTKNDGSYQAIGLARVTVDNHWIFLNDYL